MKVCFEFMKYFVVCSVVLIVECVMECDLCLNLKWFLWLFWILMVMIVRVFFCSCFWFVFIFLLIINLLIVMVCRFG